MSRVISFRTDDDIAAVIDKEVRQLDEEENRSLVVKDLVEEAVEARRTPIGTRLGLSDRRAAQIEALRRPGETEEDVVGELVRDAIDAQDEDVLDAIGASDELRAEVEEAREEGESLDGTVERLLRRGLDVPTGPLPRGERLVLGASFVFVATIYILLWEMSGLGGVVFATAFLLGYFAVYPKVSAVMGRGADLLPGK